MFPTKKTSAIDTNCLDTTISSTKTTVEDEVEGPPTRKSSDLKDFEVPSGAPGDDQDLQAVACNPVTNLVCSEDGGVLNTESCPCIDSKVDTNRTPPGEAQYSSNLKGLQHTPKGGQPLAAEWITTFRYCAAEPPRKPRSEATVSSYEGSTYPERRKAGSGKTDSNPESLEHPLSAVGKKSQAELHGIFKKSLKTMEEGEPAFEALPGVEPDAEFEAVASGIVRFGFQKASIKQPPPTGTRLSRRMAELRSFLRRWKIRFLGALTPPVHVHGERQPQSTNRPAARFRVPDQATEWSQLEGPSFEIDPSIREWEPRPVRVLLRPCFSEEPESENDPDSTFS